MLYAFKSAFCDDYYCKNQNTKRDNMN